MWNRSGLEVMELDQKQNTCGLEVPELQIKSGIDMDQKYWSSTRNGLEVLEDNRSGLDVLEVKWKWIRSTGSRIEEVLEVEQKWIRTTGSRLEVD